jgi:hypothetical protein
MPNVLCVLVDRVKRVASAAGAGTMAIIKLKERKKEKEKKKTLGARAARRHNL